VNSLAEMAPAQKRKKRQMSQKRVTRKGKARGMLLRLVLARTDPCMAKFVPRNVLI
jgi:hypothetical protein